MYIAVGLVQFQSRKPLTCHVCKMYLPKYIPNLHANYSSCALRFLECHDALARAVSQWRLTTAVCRENSRSPRWVLHTGQPGTLHKM